MRCVHQVEALSIGQCGCDICGFLEWAQQIWYNDVSSLLCLRSEVRLASLLVSLLSHALEVLENAHCNDGPSHVWEAMYVVAH